MKRVSIAVNIINFFAALGSVSSGIIVWKILPYGGGFRGVRLDAEANLFLGLQRHAWMDIHAVFSLIFAVLVIGHLILHWYWIKALPKIIKQGI